MDGFDRIYDLHRILKNRKTSISTQDICQQMECSRATFNRVKRHMTDFLGAPIEYDRQSKGYRYVEEGNQHFELPGLWFSQQELHALLLIRDLVHSLGVGILKDEITPIERRINTLLAQSGVNLPNFTEHFRLLGVATRKVESAVFVHVTNAIVNGECITIAYEKRAGTEKTERDISPQRLINYRNNWYLDAWCHKQKAYRTFALEGIHQVAPASAKYERVAKEKLDRYFQASYGIYAGGRVEQARILFAPSLAKRIAKEEWHPDQIGKFLNDGSYELSLPFNADQPQELIMDVVKYLDKAQITEPVWLRERVRETLKNTLEVYG